MTIGLIDVDGHNFPNLALMKISAWHKAKGDTVEWWWGLGGEYDLVYMSKVFDGTYTPDIPEPLNAKRVIKGGTGYGLKNRLPDEVEHIYPDYSLYPELTKETAYGFLTRGCPRGCDFCIVAGKEGRRSVKVADLSEWWSGQKRIELLDPNLLACPDHMNLLQQLKDSGAQVDFNQGLDARLLTPENIDLINAIRLKDIHFAWDYMKESEKVLKGLRLYRDRARRKVHGDWGTVYVLTNHGTTMEQNLYRVNTLIDLGYCPYIMIFDKPNAPKEIKDLQRWCNRFVYKSEPDFTNMTQTGKRIRRTTMDRQALITRFEAELGRVNRPGIDKLMGYIRGSDFYTAPASTKFHLSCEGGLLQHSLNVLDALRGLLAFNTITGFYEYHAAEKVVAEIPAESVTVAALLHDICKTYFYGTSTRNQKNDATGKWEKVPYYTVEDKMPLGHGPKSAMIVKQYMELTTPEMYAIWWHMGFNGNYENDTAAGASFEKYPLALALYTADMMASRLMEGEKQNKALFAEPSPATAGEFGEDPGTGEPDAPPPAAEWQEAPPLKEGA